MPESGIVGPIDEGMRGRILEFVSKNGIDASFRDFFWKECEPHSYELKRYPLYVRVLQLIIEGRPKAEIARITGAKKESINKWSHFKQMPKLGHFLRLYLQLGRPKSGLVWLSVNNTSGHAIPLGPFIQVPQKVSVWNDVANVIAQLNSLDDGDTIFTREYMFGFLIGMVIGDSAKSRSKNWHRHLGLVLSKKYQTNERIGEFTSLCAHSVGIRMHRVSEQPKPKSKPHGFYQWVSQASPLVDWIFNVCLGLKDTERTTYDPVKMDWVTSSPEDFRRGLVQGIAESDGSVSIASQSVEFWIGPNWDFFKGVLSTFGVRSFQNRGALSVTKSQIVNLARIPPFAPHLKTVRYQRFEKLAHAQHIGHGQRVPSEIREFVLTNYRGSSIPELSERILDRFGVVLTFEAVQRWVRKGMERGSRLPRGWERAPLLPRRPE